MGTYEIGAESSAGLKSRSTLLHGGWLTVAQLVWGLLLIAMLGVFALAVPERFVQIMDTGTQYRVTLAQFGITLQFFALYFVIPEVVIMLLFTIISLTIFWRRANDWVSMLMSLTLVGVALLFLPVVPALLESRFWRVALAVISLSQCFGILFFYWFPDGRVIPRWSRYLVFFWIGVGLVVPWMPLSILSSIYFDIFLLVLGYGLGIAFQIYRHFWVAAQEERRRTRLVVLGATASIVTYFIVYYAQDAIFSQLSLFSGIWAFFYYLIGNIAFTYLPPLLLLFAIGFSAFRYRLWDLDFIINRSLVYGTLSGLLGGLYLALVGLLTLFARIAFSWGNSTLVVFVSTLFIALAFNPLRTRVQRAIDRTFYP